MLAALVVPLAGPATAEEDPLPGVVQKHWGDDFDDVGVLAHSESGRIMAFARSSKLGRWVHFGIGRRTTSGGCVPTRWIVLDQENGPAAKVYDGRRDPVDVIERFTAVGEFVDDPSWMGYVRLAIAPGFRTDCVRMFSTATRSPDSQRLSATRTSDLEPMTDLGHHYTVLEPVGKLTWGEDTTIHWRVEARPDSASWDSLLVPPVPVSIDATLPDGSGLAVVAPTTPQELDLWHHDELVTGLLVVHPANPYLAHPRIRVTAAGFTLGEDGVASYDQVSKRVSVPVPDWTDSLAGQTRWGRAPDKWDQPYHSVLTFLDDEWVVVADRAPEDTTSCTVVNSSLRHGCHRYYYDAATNQLQIDDMRLRPTSAGWVLPWRPEPIRHGSSIAPIPAGERLRYFGVGGTFDCTPLRAVVRGCAVNEITLRLRRDGTYVFTLDGSFSGTKDREHHGTYQFTGSALVLDPAHHEPVTLPDVVGYWDDGVVKDIDWSWAGVYKAT